MSSTLTITPAIIWHSLSVTFAWTLLVPISTLISRHLKGAPSPSSFNLKLHRYTTTLAFILTIQAYLIALFTFSSSNTAKHNQHPMLASALILILILQVVSATMRPNPNPNCTWRRIWRVSHLCLGFCVIVFALYILQHSLWIFGVHGWLKDVILSAVVLGAVLVVLGFIATLFIGIDGGGGGVHVQHLNGYEEVEMDGSCAEIEIEQGDIQGRIPKIDNFYGVDNSQIVVANSAAD